MRNAIRLLCGAEAGANQAKCNAKTLFAPATSTLANYYLCLFIPCTAEMGGGERGQKGSVNSNFIRCLFYSVLHLIERISRITIFLENIFFVFRRNTKTDLSELLKAK